jgi:hypothetical protein
MTNTSKLALIAALAVSIASPAFAQSFNKGDGTGNELPFAYGLNGTKPAWTVAPQNQQVAALRTTPDRLAVRRNGRDSFAAVDTSGLYNYAGGAITPQATPNANSPAETGGGSTGYNQMLLNY